MSGSKIDKDYARKFGEAVEKYIKETGITPMQALTKAQESSLNRALKESGTFIPDPKQAAIDELVEALEWFCGRVEKGEVRSRRTYTRYKELIAKHKEQTNDR